MTRVLLVAAGVVGGCVLVAAWALGMALMDLGADFDPDPYGEEE